MMSPLALTDIAQKIGVQYQGEIEISAISTDTRTIEAGQLFVALSGDNFNGNAFVEQAANAGASAAVVSERVAADIPQLMVSDTRLALGQIANMNRCAFKGPLVGLTGSAGKTTCKEMIASILSECGSVLATKANLNNEIGVPLTLLNISPEHDFAVIEMGAGRANDIRYLTQFAQPNIALLTNALAVHIEGFGDLQTVVNTKGQILENLPNDGWAVINADSPHVEQWRKQSGTDRIVEFSQVNPTADFYASDIELLSDGKTRFSLHFESQIVEIQLKLLGTHNITNAIAAAAVAHCAGAGVEQIKAGLERLTPVKGRLNTISASDLLIIDDSYNANPDSVKAAIDVLVNFSGKRTLVLGTMAELGEKACELHCEVAEYARAKGVDQFFFSGRIC